MRVLGPQRNVIDDEIEDGATELRIDHGTEGTRILFRIRNEDQAAQRQQRAHMLTEHEPASNDFRAVTVNIGNWN